MGQSLGVCYLCGTLRSFRVVVPEDLDGLRLDQCLARLIPELSRKKAQVALSVGCVFCDKRRTKVASRAVRQGEELSVHLGAPFDSALSPEGAFEAPPVDVLFEDRDLVVIHKPSGTHSVPTPEGDVGTALHQLEVRTGRRQTLFVVHRLDMPTSGILVFAKTKLADRSLSETFKRHDLTRRYDAFVVGKLAGDRRIDAPLRGKRAVTHVRVLEQVGPITWVEATLETGRTHQIRRHLADLGHPVTGDTHYGRAEPPCPRLGLHAKHLSFLHPRTGAGLSFDAALPDDLERWLKDLRTGLPQAPL